MNATLLALAAGAIGAVVCNAALMRLLRAPGRQSPWRKAAVAAATLVLAVLFERLFDVSWLMASRLVLAFVLIVLFVCDAEDRLLPNAITLPGILIGLAFSCVAPPGIGAAVAGVAIGGGAPWLVAEAYERMRGVEGMGMGDVKMLGMLGAFLGWRGAVASLALASMAGALYGLGLMATKRGTLSTSFPFGVFIAASAILVVIFSALEIAVAGG